MDAKKIAQETPEEERISKSEQYLLDTANNQKKAAQELNKQLDNVNAMFSGILEIAPREDFTQVNSVITQANKLLNDAKKGGDINSIINDAKNIK
jgi:hypothetical protein